MTATAPARATGAQALDSYLRVLAGPAPGARLLEIRFALRHRDMGRLFIAAHSAPGAARLIRRLAVRTDVYVGVCLRSRRAGGRDAIDRSHLAFVEIDAPDALDRLRAFPHPPTMIISSGTPWARARVLRPVRAGHRPRARAGQPTPRARSRRRSRVRRRRANLAGRRRRGITSTRRRRQSSSSSSSRRVDTTLDRLVDGLDDPHGQPPAVRLAAAEPLARNSTGCFWRSRPPSTCA